MSHHCLKISVSSAKGGVGKTTVAVNFAHACAELEGSEQKLRPLLIDMDAQGDATALLGHTQPDGTSSLPYESSVVKMMDGEAATPVEKYGVYVVGYHEDAAGRGLMLSQDQMRLKFMRGIQATIDEFQPDIVIFDAPPLESSASGPTALMSSDYVIVALQPHPRGAAAARATVDSLEDWSQIVNRKIHLAGVVPIMRSRTRAVTEVMDDMRTLFGNYLTAEIPVRTVFVEASNQGMPVVEYERFIKEGEPRNWWEIRKKRSKKYSEMGLLFQEVADQILERINLMETEGVS